MGRPRRPIEERFWEKVQRGTDTECWLWTGSLDRDGYGERIRRVGDERVRPHRFAYELLVGPIPDGLQIDHLCRVRSCVNPTHLEAVTGAENIRRGETGQVRGQQQRAKTHCPQGHEYTGENIYWYKGGRQCRACKRERSPVYQKRAYRKRRAAAGR